MDLEKILTQSFISKFEDPGCYDLTKRAALNTEDRESTMKLPTASAVHPANSSKSDL